MLKAQAGIDLLVVPYKGSGPAVTDLLGGQIQLLIDAPPVTMAHVKAGKLKAIAVTGKTRLAALPDVPTFEEAGVAIDASGWQGVAVPAGHAARNHCESYRTRWRKQSRSRTCATSSPRRDSMPCPRRPKQFRRSSAPRYEKWIRVAKSANIKVE